MAPPQVDLNAKQPLENVQVTVVGGYKLLPLTLSAPPAVETGADTTTVAARRAVRRTRCGFLLAGVVLGAFIATILIGIIITLDYNFNRHHFGRQGTDNAKTEGKPGCVTIKPGHEALKKEEECPKPGPDTKGECQDQCERDQDCAGEYKCCPTSCGASACTKPVHSKTCGDVICSSQEQCREVYDYFNSSQVSLQCLGKPPTSQAQCAVGTPLLLLHRDGTVSEVFCGRGWNAVDCPDGYRCNVSPLDAFAVCCRNPEAGPKDGKEEGQCPKPGLYDDTTFGECQDQCKWDTDCKEGYKCCPTACGALACTRSVHSKTCDDVVCNYPEKCREVYSGNNVSAQCLVTPPTPHPEAQCAVGRPLLLLQSNGTVSEAGCNRRGWNAMYCPEGYHCNVSTNNAAVCCRNQDRCLLPKDPGPCEAAGTVYYYNSTEGRCMTFIYGACEGNANRFSSRDDCRVACSRHVCKLPREIGMCRAYIPSYFYNSERGECEHFIYGGCQGNDNRFSSKEDCENLCLVE